MDNNNVEKYLESVETVKTEFIEMGDLDKQKLKETVKAFTDEDKTEIVKLFPSDKLWEELIRRNLLMNEILDNICEIMGVAMDGLSPISAKTWCEIKNKFDNIEDKYTKIRKGFSKHAN